MTYVGRGLHRSWSSPCLYEKGRRAEGDNLVGDLGENEVHVVQRDYQVPGPTSPHLCLQFQGALQIVGN